MIEFISDVVLAFIVIYFFRQLLSFIFDGKNRMYRKRLKNVYDLLETGNNKKCIQEVDKLISETSVPQKNKKKLTQQMLQFSSEPGYDEEITLIIGKALKCLALVRTGRRTEADILMDQLLNANIQDDNALNIVHMTFKTVLSVVLP